MINDLQPKCPSVKYVDDTTIYHISSEPDSNTIQNEADYVLEWSNVNNMRLNATKTKEMIINFSKKTQHFQPISINGVEIERVKCFKVLGVHLSSDLTWKNHVDYITSPGNQQGL